MRRLHKVFAVSSVLLTIVTIWMFAHDHLREWKKVQRTSERIETRLAKWQQLQTLSDDVASERQRLQLALSELLSQPFSESILDSFCQAVRADAQRRQVGEPSFEELNRARAELEKLAAAAQIARNGWQQLQLELDKSRLRAEDAAARVGSVEGEEAGQLQEAARKLAAAAEQSQRDAQQAAAELESAQAAVVPARDRVLDQLRSLLREARFRKDERARMRKGELAQLDVDKARLGAGARDEIGDAALKKQQDRIDARTLRIDELTLAADAATAHHERLRNLLTQLTASEEAVRRRLDENDAETQRLAQLLAEKRSTYFNFWGIVPVPGKKWLELPILDAFNSPRKIENLWSEGLDRRAGSFGRVPRFDRCTTCHQGIQKSLPASPARPALRESVVLDLALPLPELPLSELPLPELTLPELTGVGPASGEDHDAAELESIFGIALAAEGLMDPDDVTVRFVRPASLGRRARNWNDVGKSMRAGDIRVQFMFADKDPPDKHSAAGFLVGDVIVAVDDQQVPEGVAARQWVTERLIGAVRNAGNSPQGPLLVRVRRGLPHPYAGHPRLDLFVGDNSPHNMADFACTVCHEGQGSATAFKWASHTPNDVASRDRWRAQYGWFDNTQWIYPMHPQRFVESSCLKCHHDVVELERSQRFPDAPAPKLAAGYRTIRTLGCFGCHEIQGYGSPQRRIGPDLRLEPNYYAAALQFRGVAGAGYESLTDAERANVDGLIETPEDESLRQAVYDMMRADASKAADRSRTAALAAAQQRTTLPDGVVVDEPRFSEDVHQRLLPLLQPQETPGALRKVGPSLRFVRHKLDPLFLSDWIRQPSHFRPSTRMPQAFGLWNHLPAQQLRVRRAALLKELAGEEQGGLSRQNRTSAEIVADLDAVDAELARVDEVEKRFEPVAIYSMVQYLLQRSQIYQNIERPPGITPIVTDADKQVQIDRGGVAFQELGCLACHNHVDFPDIAKYRDADFIVQGPDLSDTAAKFAADRNPQGPQWLYSWITQPTRYSVRTTMPAMMLQPIEQRDADGNVTAVTDPVADIVAYLLNGPVGDWQPGDEVLTQLDEQSSRVLEELTLVHLRDVFPEVMAQRYAREGIPFSQQSQLRGAERELVVTPAEQESLDSGLMMQKRIAYVAQKSFTARGCFACHDIPGMEDAKPIGPSLNDWGRKDTGLLAFGHVDQYVQRNLPSSGEPPAEESPGSTPTGSSDVDSSQYYQQQLRAHNRIGFIHQKLTEPRSFDYHEARNKKYTARLRMPQFTLTAAEREAIMTFALGLVADPPRPKYVYVPDRHTKAVLDGTEVLTKYSCRGCHVLETEKWQLAFAPDQYGERLGDANYPFVPAHFDQQERAQSKSIDRRGLRQSLVSGMPALSDDGLPRIFDDEEFPIEEEEDESFELDRLLYSFDLWQPALVDGYPYQVGSGALDVFAENLIWRRHSYGGALTKYLLPRVVEREKEVNPNAKGAEAWSWLPPVLAGEGLKVQPDWLHNYLLRPHPVRPAVVMRMPRYNMSIQEAAKLVDYFAAIDQAVYPYSLEPVRQAEHLAMADQQYAQRLERLAGEEGVEPSGSLEGRHLEDAMKLVTDGGYCVKCHLIGDYNPPGIERVKGPDLANVHQRLRSDYLRKWLAKPNSLQPYTPMPVNIPYDPEAPLQGTNVPQELYHGNSTQQLDAVVDLLMNYDRYAQQRSPVTPMVTSGRDAKE